MYMNPGELKLDKIETPPKVLQHQSFTRESGPYHSCQGRFEDKQCERYDVLTEMRVGGLEVWCIMDEK